VPPINPKPLSLSDAELDAVMRAVAPLHQMDRSAFLVAVAERLGFESTSSAFPKRRMGRLSAFLSCE
jgi:hypothetical protein